MSTNSRTSSPPRPSSSSTVIAMLSTCATSTSWVSVWEIVYRSRPVSVYVLDRERVAVSRGLEADLLHRSLKVLDHALARRVGELSREPVGLAARCCEAPLGALPQSVVAKDALEEAAVATA